MRAHVLCLAVVVLAAAGCDRSGAGSVDAGTARIEMNEALAVAHLKCIAAAQTQAQGLAVVDTDEDGVGEFAFVAELGGARKPRGPGQGVKFPLLGGTYSRLGPGGFVEADGYLFRVFLPGEDGAAAAEGASGGGTVSANGAEREWIAYAWPVRYGATGKRTFVAGSSGALGACDAPAHSGDRKSVV